MLKKTIAFALLLILITLDGYSQNKSYKFLALGDSYTIGESVALNQRWPVQLAAQLNSKDIKVDDPLIVARTGWTTNELQQAIKSREIPEEFDMVSLLIGVNNQYRGYDINQYIKEFEELLKTAISYADNNADRVFIVSIPNYGVTPFGMTRGEEKIRKELLNYDAIAEGIASKYNIPFINITPVSEKAKNDKSYIASDELHPSGKQYKEWVELILPVATKILEDKKD